MIVTNLRRAASLARDAGVQLLLEPVSRVDGPGISQHRRASRSARERGG
jgi:hydroxypyruvate isomerase